MNEGKDDFWDELPEKQVRQACEGMWRELILLRSRETLEDRFAMAALTGLLSGPALKKLTDQAASTGQVFGECVAETAFKFARACMAERSKK